VTRGNLRCLELVELAPDRAHHMATTESGWPESVICAVARSERPAWPRACARSMMASTAAAFSTLVLPQPGSEPSPWPVLMAAADSSSPSASSPESGVACRSAWRSAAARIMTLVCLTTGCTG
jgi:hypothetical protein